ncbi:hypothetical protein TCA2_5948 [Paenibacillus sp. TCA20]|uniref:hypothetical protein n=1 Tax=Paenibacillus sp. TCA20 TaxID=1499968 RepID=UPI0004D645B8|nr:hypothetical protein [Paenibacillus sp. TCA20]GAK43450.1 hypothetical protein TCA2_5948 [Paenibacillus sp. TCA20]
MNRGINNILCLLLVILVSFTGFSIHEYRLSPDFFRIEDLGSLSNKTHLNVDQISFESEKIVIKGWAVLVGKPSDETNLSIILVDKENPDNYKIFKPEMLKRVDVTEHFNDGFNYDSSGFEIVVSKRELLEGIYRIGVQISTDSTKYQLIGKENITI